MSCCSSSSSSFYPYSLSSSMAKKQHPNKTYDRRRSPCRLLCCFGFSDEKEMITCCKESIPAVDPSDHGKSNNKITVRLAFLRLRVKSNRASIKTVPVLLDAVPEKPERDIKMIHYWSKPKSKSTDQSSPPPTTTTTTTATEIETVVPTSPDKKPKDNKPLQNNTNLDNRKHPDDTCHKRLSFTRRIDAIRSGGGSSQPGSPRGPAKPARAPKHNNSASEPVQVRSKRVKPGARTRKSGGFEPVVGMSVVMVTLVIMVMWGRVCAILCTSAWLYFVPRLSTAVVDPAIRALGSGSGTGRLDLGSEEYKKKVVFEGFLERNNNNNNNNINHRIS